MTDCPIAKLVFHNQSHRYYVTLAGGKAEQWSGASSHGKLIESTVNLERWKVCSALTGAALQPTLLRRFAIATARDEQDAIIESLLDAAKANEGRDFGSDAHRVTELFDMNRLPISDPWTDAIVERWAGALEAAEITIDPNLVERIVLLPEMKICATFDREAHHQGELIVVDIKGLSLDTLLPTPTGWTTIADVNVGDQVIGSDGRPCTVTAKSDVHWHDCYRMVFDDTSSVVADAEHRWLVSTFLKKEGRVLTTAEIAGSVRAQDGRGQRQHRISNAAPLDLPDADLPIHPYTLGVWLGDGAARGGQITKPVDHPVWAALEANGETLDILQVDKRTGCGAYTVQGLTRKLRLNGLQHNKHIPAAYLRASRAQRLSLLQGLMDTDGTWNKTRHQAVFGVTSKQLAHQVYELVVSLGWHAIINEVEQEGFGVKVTCYYVPWTAFGMNPFQARGAVVAPFLGGTEVSRRRLIQSVERVPTVPTQCIMVDSPDHTYLCTEHMIPTHNTGAKAAQYPHTMTVQCALIANAPWITSGEPVRKADTSTWTTFEPAPRVSRQRALIVTMSADSDGSEVWELDIESGWEAAKLAHQAKLWGKTRPARQIATWTPVGDAATATSASPASPVAQPQVSAPTQGGVDDGLRDRLVVWLRQRVRIIVEAGHGPLLARRWPASTPTFKACTTHTLEQLDAICDVCVGVEADKWMPFGEPDPRIPDKPMKASAQ